MSSPMLVANSANRVMPLPGDLRCPSQAGDADGVGPAFAEFLRSNEPAVGPRPGRSEIAFPDQREGHAEPPRRTDPSRSSPSRPRPVSAESPPEAATANAEQAVAPSREPEKPSSSGTSQSKEDSPDDVEEVPAGETAAAEQIAQLPGDQLPALVPDAPVRLQAADPAALPSDATPAPASSVQGDGAGAAPPAAPAHADAMPPRVPAAVSQLADPVVSISPPVAGLEILDGNPADLPAAAPVATATADAAPILSAASVVASQAQPAAGVPGPSSPTVGPFDRAAGAEAGAPMAICAAGDTSEAGDGAGDTGNPADGGEGDRSGSAPAAAAPTAMAAGRSGSVRSEGATVHPVATQLAAPVVRAAKAGVQRVEIALEPAALGRVDVRLDFSADGRVSAFFVAENRTALDALRADAQTLTRALADAGVDTGSLNFGLRQGAQNNDGGSYPSPSGRASAESSAVGPQPSIVAAAASGPYASSTGRLDIRA